MAAGKPTALVWRDKSDRYFMISETGVREFKMDAEKGLGEDGYGGGTISKSSDIVARLLIDQKLLCAHFNRVCYVLLRALLYCYHTALKNSCWSSSINRFPTGHFV